MRQYALKFTKFSKYAPFMVANPRVHMSKFIFGVSDLVFKECETAMLVMEIDIYCLMTYAEQIEEENLKEKARESKRAQVDGGSYSQ